jgi:tetratricopeptide (TPR) repeat protein
MFRPLHRAQAVSERVLACAIAVAWFLTSMPVWADESERLLSYDCGPYRYVDLGHIDYRLAKGDPIVAKGVRDLDHYHTQPAARELAKVKPYARDVMVNLDFTLRHSPNHHEALGLLIRHELAGGPLLEFPNSACYLGWAQRFAPNDDTVYSYGGAYFWKKGEIERADAWYRRALELNADSAEAHYNYGLMLFDQKRFNEARQHASIAYAKGYPLPGLRDKLSRAGYSIK